MFITPYLALLCLMVGPSFSAIPKHMSDEQLVVAEILTKNRLRNPFKVARPVMDYRSTVTVEAGLAIGALRVINADMANVAVGIIQYFRWQDEFLQWHPDDFNGLDMVQLPTDGHIWQPDILRLVHTIKGRGRSDIPMTVTNEGIVTQVVPAEMDMRCFKSPDGDSEDTHLLICPFAYGAEHVPPSVQDIVPWEGYEQINIDKMLLSPEGVEVVENVAERVVADFEPFNSSFAHLHYKLTLRVRSGDKPKPLKTMMNPMNAA